MASESTAPASQSPTLVSQVSRAVFWNTLFVPIRFVAELISTLLKLTVLQQASYGLLALMSYYSSGIGTYIDLGTGRALPKYIPETLRAGGIRAMSRLINIVIGAQLALLGIVAAGFLLLHDFFFNDLRARAAQSITNQAEREQLMGFISSGGWLLIGIVLMMLLIGIFSDVLLAYLSSFFKQRAWNSIQLVANLLPKLLTIGVIAGLAYQGTLSVVNAAIGVLSATVIGQAIVTAYAAWLVFRLRHEIEALSQPSDNGRTLPPGFIRYCAVSLLMTGTDFLASAGFVVFFTKNLVDVAVLVAGVSMVQLALGYLFTPMVGVQVPLFTRVRQGEGMTLQTAYQSLIRLQVLLLVPGGVGLLLLAQPLFAILPQYSPAAQIVWVLVPCLFLECLLTTAHNALIVYEHLRMIVIARVLTLVVVPLIIVLEPMLGVVGMALAFGLARVIAGAWVTGNGARLLGLRWPWRFTLRVLAASGVMALVVGGLVMVLPPIFDEASFLERLTQAAYVLGIAGVGAVALIGALRLLGGLDARDREQLAAMKLPFKKWILKVV